MNAKLFLALALASAGAPRAAEEDIITKSFSVKPGDNLIMRVDRGAIRVRASNDAKVEVRVVRELKNASAEKAKEAFAMHKIEFSQSDGAVRIESENPQKLRSFFNSPLNRLRVEYTITVPSRFDLDLRTAGGNIDIDDLEGEVNAHTAGGNVNIASIQGAINAHTSGGNITVKSGRGNASLHTSGGDLRIGAIDGDLVAKTSGGNISLERVTGSTEAVTSGGDIRIRDALGPVTARTSGGNVSARLSKQPKGDCALRTSGGNVDVAISEKLAVDLDARTSGGSIRSDFPGDMNKQRTKLAARLNGGGPSLALETSGGNVEIRKQ